MSPTRGRVDPERLAVDGCRRHGVDTEVYGLGPPATLPWEFEPQNPADPLLGQRRDASFDLLWREVHEEAGFPQVEHVLAQRDLGDLEPPRPSSGVSLKEILHSRLGIPHREQICELAVERPTATGTEVRIGFGGVPPEPHPIACHSHDEAGDESVNQVPPASTRCATA